MWRFGSGAVGTGLGSANATVIRVGNSTQNDLGVGALLLYSDEGL